MRYEGDTDALLSVSKQGDRDLMAWIDRLNECTYQATCDAAEAVCAFDPQLQKCAKKGLTKESILT